MSIKKNKSRIDLTEGPIFSNLLKFAVPILLGSIVTQFYNIADSVIVGQFVGSQALAAVSASSPLMSFINMFMIGLSSGSNVIIAQRMGAKNQKALQEAVGTVSCLTLICSVFITILGLCISKPLLRVLGTPENIFADSLSYISIVFLGTIGNMVYQMGSGALRGMGDSSWPFYFLLLCSVLNIVFNLLAVVVLGLGVIGVAIATALAQLISGIGILFRLNRGGYGVKVSFSTMRLSKTESGSIIAIGLPAAIQNVGNSIAALCVQTSVNFFGSDFIAANSIVTKVDDMINIPIMALSTALCTYVGQNMGVFRMDRIKKGINDSILSLCALGVFMCGILIAMRNVFPYMFTTDANVARIAGEGLFIMSFMCLFHGIDRCLVNAMRGAGKSVVPMVTAQFGAFSRIPLAYFLGVCTGNYKGIFFALLIASFLRTVAIAFYYYCGGWKKAVAKFEEKHRQKTAEA
ncbi:MAG: MATE family efflux transporter [Clostridiales bacterium]|nr:MATE family efflux transporter [Clostridiales bacterium]